MATSRRAELAAIDLVKTALQAGWLNGASGEKLAREVADAIEAIAKRLQQD